MSKETTFTFRVDLELKREFQSATETENRPVAQVLRDLMASYVERKKKEEFEVEARRQSLLVVGSPDEEKIMDWISDVADVEDWK